MNYSNFTPVNSFCQLKNKLLIKINVRMKSYYTAKFESPPARGSKTQQVSPFCNQQEFKKTETSPLPDPGTAPSTIRNSGLFLSFRKNYVKAVRK